MEFSVSETTLGPIIVALIAALAAVITAWINNRNTNKKFKAAEKQYREQKKKIDAVHFQTQNNHGTSLKDAVDRTEAAHKEFAHEMKQLLTDMAHQSEMRHEEQTGRMNVLETKFDAVATKAQRNRDDIDRLRDWSTLVDQRHDKRTGD